MVHQLIGSEESKVVTRPAKFERKFVIDHVMLDVGRR